eukprot:15084845-Heterocapsa_arctica.AAC.1
MGGRGAGLQCACSGRGFRARLGSIPFVLIEELSLDIRPGHAVGVELVGNDARSFRKPAHQPHLR